MTWNLERRHGDLFKDLDPLPDCFTEHNLATLINPAGQAAQATCECGREWYLLEVKEGGETHG